MKESLHAHSIHSTQSRLADEEQCLPHLTKAQTGHSKRLKTVKSISLMENQARHCLPLLTPTSCLHPCHSHTILVWSSCPVLQATLHSPQLTPQATVLWRLDMGSKKRISHASEHHRKVQCTARSPGLTAGFVPHTGLHDWRTVGS